MRRFLSSSSFKWAASIVGPILLALLGWGGGRLWASVANAVGDDRTTALEKRLATVEANERNTHEILIHIRDRLEDVADRVGAK